MNLKKYTKDELIRKLQKSKNDDSKNSILNQINLYLSEIWKLILTFKNILLKLTLISLFLQFFKKNIFYNLL